MSGFDLYNFHTSPETLYGFKNRHLLPYMVARKITVHHQPLENLTKQERRSLVQNPTQSVLVAMATKTRLPEAESRIAEHPELAFDYALYVIKGPFPDAEPVFLDFDNGYIIAQYAYRCLSKRWPDGEERLFELGDHENIARYAGNLNLRVRYYPDTREYMFYSPMRAR